MRSLTRGKGIAAASSITTSSAWPSLCASDGWMYYKRRVDICYWFGGVKKVQRLRTSLEVITICNVSIAIVKLRLMSKKSPRVNNTEILRNGIISVSPVSHCVPCAPQCPMCPIVSRVQLCPLCPLVSPVPNSVPCVPCVPLSLLCPLCPLVYLVSPRVSSVLLCPLFFVFFLSSYFYPSACFRLFSLWPFFAPRDFCDNVCLVVGPCTSKTRKNIYLNCLPVFSKDIHSNNCFVEFRISWLHQLVI